MIEIKAEFVLEDTRVVNHTIRIEGDVPKQKRGQLITNLAAQFCNTGLTDYDDAAGTAIHYAPKLINHINFEIIEHLITEVGPARVIEGTISGSKLVAA